MDEIIIDIKTTNLTMRQLVKEVEKLQTEDPRHEYLLNGDLYAIVRRDLWNSEA